MPAPAKTLNIRALYSNLLQYRAHFTHKIILYTIIAPFCWGRKCNLTVWFCSLLLKSCKLGSLGNSCVVNYSIAWSLLFLSTANHTGTEACYLAARAVLGEKRGLELKEQPGDPWYNFSTLELPFVWRPFVLTTELWALSLTQFPWVSGILTHTHLIISLLKRDIPCVFRMCLLHLLYHPVSSCAAQCPVLSIQMSLKLL